MLEALSVVKAPVPAVVLPMAGGEARYVLNPVPLTVLDALRVVNAPVPAVVLPMDGGEAKSAVNPAPDTVEEADSVENAPGPPLVFAQALGATSQKSASPSVWIY